MLLGVDRTTMVALLDHPELQGIISRRPHTTDRRRNIVELTGRGRQVFRQAQEAAADAEHHFLAALEPAAAQHIRDALHVLVTGQPAQSTGGRPS